MNLRNSFSIIETKSSISTSIFILSTISQILKTKFYVCWTQTCRNRTKLFTWTPPPPREVNFRGVTFSVENKKYFADILIVRCVFLDIFWCPMIKKLTVYILFENNNSKNKNFNEIKDPHKLKDLAEWNIRVDNLKIWNNKSR